MSTSQKTLDSITIDGNAVYSDANTIGIVLQNSIRFEKFKRYAVYRGHTYVGVFECCAKSVYKANIFPEPLARLIFGSNTKESQTELNKIFRKGRFGENSEFCFLVLFKIDYQEKHEIKNLKFL